MNKCGERERGRFNWRKYVSFPQTPTVSSKPLKRLSEGEYDALIKRQFWELYEGLNLDISDDAKLVLLPQSVLGRILSGHALFKGRAREDISMDRIVTAIGMEPGVVKGQRQKMVDDFKLSIDRLLDGKSKYLVDEAGEPIYGVNFLREIELDCDKEMFKGGVIVGRMDNIDWRRRTQEFYQKTLEKKDFKIAGGKEFPVNVEMMRKYGISVRDFSEKEYSPQDIEKLMELGVIFGEDCLSGLDGVETMYIRYIRGLGICDDAALLATGVRHGLSSMVLGFCIDATDTYSKYINEVRVGGVDEFIGEHIMERWEKMHHEKLVSDEECMETIYFGAKNNYPKIIFSSSHRRFVEVEKGMPHSTFMSHAHFLRSGRFQKYPLGFERVPSTEFYPSVDTRFKVGGLGGVINKSQCTGEYMRGKGHRH